VSSSSVADEEMGLSASEDDACRSLLALLMLSAPEVWRAALDLDSSLASGDKLAPLLSVASDIEIVTRALFPTA
jgi:hypothetical protein